MYEKIMVPLDGSELAEVTLWYAARLAGRLGSAITLVYVNPPNELTSPHMYECYLQDTVTRVKEQATQMAAETGGGEVAVDYKMFKGDPAEEIVDYADSAKIDMIILSTQGKSGIKRWAMGNVANKVVRATRKQVLIIRAKGAKPDVYKDKLTKVLVPVDGSRESESILRFVTQMAVKLNLEITLFHIWPRHADIYSSIGVKARDKIEKRENEYVQRLVDRLKADGVNASGVFRDVLLGSEAEEIIKLAEEGEFSMVAMATHGRSGVGRWIFGSNAEKVLNEGSTPLLLVRPVKGRAKPGPLTHKHIT
jgi:nucleotide-binding universal stress UspA family protein